MHKPIDLTGDKYGRLLVLGLSHRNKHGQKMWLCRCDCGNEKIVVIHLLRSGQTKSCGCLQKELSSKSVVKAYTKATKHGMSKTRFYQIWENMKLRCNNPKAAGYKNYGGRGITICDRWDSFENFKEDMYESYELRCYLHSEESTTIERIDVNKGYSPENCTWANKSTQNTNRRTNTLYEYKNDLYTLGYLAEIAGIKSGTLSSRIHGSGWSVEKAVETPLNKESNLVKWMNKNAK